jgi:hypothetical protein
LAQHVLRSRAGRLSELDAELAGRVDRDTLEQAVHLVPQPFFAPLADADTIARRRSAFVAFLWKRLKSPRPFVAP